MPEYDYKKGMTSNQAYSPPSNNQGSPGGPGGYNPDLNTPEVTYTSPPQNNNQDDNNQVNATPPGGAAGFTPPTSGPTEEEIKMAMFQEAQANYDKYGDDLSSWMEDQDAYEDAYDIGFFQAQNEGMLGGVTEYEKQSNLLKKAIASKVGKMNTQGLTDAQFQSGLTSLPAYQQLLQLFDGNVAAMENTLFAPGTFDQNVNTGYDNTGTNTFQDTENDPELYAAYQLLSQTDGNPYSDEYFDALGKINYEFPSFDENFYGSDYWDDYLGEYYGPTERSAYEKNKRWQQKSLGEILQQGPAGFGDLQRIYGEELSETSANPFAAVSQYNKQGAFSPSFGESIITEYS